MRFSGLKLAWTLGLTDPELMLRDALRESRDEDTFMCSDILNPFFCNRITVSSNDSDISESSYRNLFFSNSFRIIF